MLNLPRPLRSFLYLCAAITAACLVTELVCAFVLHLPAVYTFPLFVGWPFFDFECYHQCIPDLHTAQFFGPGHTWPWSYPAPMGVLYAFFFMFPGDPLIYFLASAALLLLVLALLLTRAAIRRGLRPRTAVLTTTALLLLSYPIAFAFERANLELYVFFVLAVGLWAFVTDRLWLAALCFGVAGSMKIFPIVYLGLHLSRRRYLHCLAGLVAAGVSTVLSLWFLGPTIPIAWRGIQQGVEIFRQAFLLRPRLVEFGFDHSLFGFYRRFIPSADPNHAAHALTTYLVCAAVAGLALYWFRIRKLPVINQVLALTVAAILLPPASFDYTLIHLYLPLALIFLAILSAPTEVPRGLRAILIMLAVLVSAESELIFHGIRVASQLKCLALLTLFAQALYYPLRTTFDLAAD